MALSIFLVELNEWSVELFLIGNVAVNVHQLGSISTLAELIYKKLIFNDFLEINLIYCNFFILVLILVPKLKL